VAGLKALLDTNILIDYLKGIAVAREEVERYSEAAISVITWMEVMAGAKPEEETGVRGFLSGFIAVPLSAAVMEQAVIRRREYRLKLPDAIIYASADVEKCLLVTRNTKDFLPDDPRVRVPYRL
jgi:predicted nucleic acid-binding protein